MGLHEMIRVFSLGLRALSRVQRVQIAAQLAREQAVLSVCTVYPRRVPVARMNMALAELDLNPAWVYQALAAGASIPDLDAAVEEVAKPW